MPNAQGAALVGLLLNLVGVILLFRYGMPFRVETKGASSFLLEGTDQDAVQVERHYRRLGELGLLLIVVGSGLQAFAILIA